MAPKLSEAISALETLPPATGSFRIDPATDLHLLAKIFHAQFGHGPTPQIIKLVSEAKAAGNMLTVTIANGSVRVNYGSLPEGPRKKRHPVRRKDVLSSTESAPPEMFAFLLACVARKGRAEELLGDAEAEYRKMIVRFGPGLARWWYRIYVAKVVAAMAPSALVRLWIMHKLLGL